MCLSPISVDNPYYKHDPNKGYNFLHDCTCQKLSVPCGKCPECINLEQMYLVQRIQMESIKNWLYMGTVTYKNSMMPRLETEMGYTYRYFEWKDIQDCIKRLREHNSFGIPFRQIIVSERGSKRARPHAHILFLFKKEDIGKDYIDCMDFEQKHQWDLFQEWKINVGTDAKPIYNYCSEYRESYRGGKLRKTYDFHFVDPRRTGGGVTDAAFYVLKYMLKGSEHEQLIEKALKLNYGKETANYYWDIIKSRQKHSLGFGLNGQVIGKGAERKLVYDEELFQILRDGVKRSTITNNYPLFYSPENLLTFPLAPYYKSFGQIYTIEDAVTFWKKNDHETDMDNCNFITKNYSQAIKQFNEYERKLELMRNDEFAEYFDELFND